MFWHPSGSQQVQLTEHHASDKDCTTTLTWPQYLVWAVGSGRGLAVISYMNALASSIPCVGCSSHVL